MKYRSPRPIVCALGMAAVLSSCAPTSAPSTSSTPAPARTVSAPASTPDAAATPVASVTPGASVSPGAVATPGASATPSAGAAVPEVPGVKILVHKPGAGDAIAKGSAGSFHYTGWLEGYESVKKFDSSKDRNQPFDLVLGQGMVIPGWDQGLVGMQVGEIRRLEISPEMGYGAAGSPPVIPPNSVLFFEVEYLGPPK